MMERIFKFLCDEPGCQAEAVIIYGGEAADETYAGEKLDKALCELLRRHWQVYISRRYNIVTCKCPEHTTSSYK